MAKLAFLGLGVMGFHMAGHLASSGHCVTVWNRTETKTTKWIETHQGRAGESAVEAITGCDFVFMCLGDDHDVEAIAKPVMAAMKPGTILIDHTTASAKLARQLSNEAQAHKIGFLDAPVSGGEAGAKTAQLSIMVGGEASDFQKVEPVMTAYAKAITHIGPAGSGQLAKMVNQICIAGVVQGLSEGLHFAQRAGLNPQTVINAISKGAAQSWQMENRWQTMTQGEFDFGFAVKWMRKDLRIALDESRSNGARLPMTALVDQFYAEVEAMAGDRWDTSSLIARLENADKV